MSAAAVAFSLPFCFWTDGLPRQFHHTLNESEKYDKLKLTINSNFVKVQNYEKLIVHVMIAVTILFGCYNLIWYFGAYKPYDELQDNFRR